jgi:uncharacterized protein YbjT (DUF2867 family)
MESTNKTALVIGATGLVGTELVKQLLNDDRFGKVIVFGRRSLENPHPKLTEHIIDFDQPHTWQHWVQGDILFSTLGTTLKQAGGKDAQYKIDYHYQFDFAKAASEQHVPVYVLVSSASASPDSKIFYSRMKGELERDISKLPFKSISILQPSLLYGDRKEQRLGESIGYHVIRRLNALSILKKYRPIHAGTVARAMINAGIKNSEGKRTYVLDQIFQLAEVPA